MEGKIPEKYSGKGDLNEWFSMYFIYLAKRWGEKSEKKNQKTKKEAKNR